MAELAFCAICSKPFSTVTALNRHVSYCRRAQHRPNPRRRSCRACNIAKIKCSFESPCLRCVKKKVECIYGPAHANKTSAIFGVHPDADLVDASDDLPINAVDPLLLQDDVLWDELILAQEAPITNHGTESVSSLPICETGQHNYLTKMRSADAVVEYAVSLVIDALCAIPRQMTRKETFPCFIHPHWGLQLPESLTICMHLAQIYATRSMEIRPFMWRSILGEQTRVMQQLSTISKENLLAAIQAHTVYMIMRVADGATNDLDWNWEMARASRILCDRFIEMYNGQFCEEETANPSLSWEDWIFAESRRRTSSIWFLVSRTIVIMSRTDCATTEQPWALPLPAPRTQWEARSPDSWLQEIGLGTPTITTFGELVESKKRREEPEQADILDSWNATSDGLGHLLNLAANMVPSLPSDVAITI